MNAERLARDVRLMVLDVDGVLTDGGLYYDEDGCVMKRFNVQDGLGIKLGPRAGIEFAVITGLESPAVKRRVSELGIGHYYYGHHRKVPAMREISEKTGIPFAHMAYVGDDWVDAAPMSMVGLPIAVPNARPEILKLAAWTTRAPGGHGAVREALEFVLRAQGKLEPMWREWLRE
jgi:3-deoxy-D-manno-octulosonate 8-phosphate phosphatase (KDO 8-P phosphatase)